jgi:glyceraldehyde 3-phosphate dehydrogenase
MNNQNVESQFEQHLSAWREDEKTALELQKLVGALRFDKSVEIILFRRDIYDSRPSEVLNDHLFATNYVNKPISVQMSLEITKAIAKLDLSPARIDIGALATLWLSLEEGKFENIDDFVALQLDNFVGEKAKSEKKIEPKDVVIYGFGRIGRLAVRILTELMGRGEQLRLRAIVIRPRKAGEDHEEELIKRASLLRKDSIHGKLRGTVQIVPEDNQLIINSCRVQMIFAEKPEDINYNEYGINNALLIDSSGVWTDKAGLSRHLRPGIDKVLFTAPGKGIKNLVYGINHENLDLEKEEDRVFCAASCTTNAIAPILKVLNDSLGISHGHMETVHAYTSSQNLLDNYHKKERRGRGAATNMVITSSGASSALNEVLPELAGKITGSSIRVPIPDGSLAIMTLQLNRATTVDEVNQIMRNASLYGELVEQIMYSSSKEFVSSDVIGAIACSVYDAPATKISSDGKQLTVYIWYDNEYGYTRQVIRLAKYAAKVRRYMYY